QIRSNSARCLSSGHSSPDIDCVEGNSFALCRSRSRSPPPIPDLMQRLDLPWLNTTDFTAFQLALFGVGCFGWVIAYVGVAVMFRKRKYVEIPAAAVAANIAWEFVWGFIYGSNMGK